MQPEQPFWLCLRFSEIENLVTPSRAPCTHRLSSLQLIIAQQQALRSWRGLEKSLPARSLLLRTMLHALPPVMPGGGGAQGHCFHMCAVQAWRMRTHTHRRTQARTRTHAHAAHAGKKGSAWPAGCARQAASRLAPPPHAHATGGGEQLARAARVLKHSVSLNGGGPETGEPHHDEAADQPPGPSRFYALPDAPAEPEALALAASLLRASAGQRQEAEAVLPRPKRAVKRRAPVESFTPLDTVDEELNSALLKIPKAQRRPEP